MKQGVLDHLGHARIAQVAGSISSIEVLIQSFASLRIRSTVTQQLPLDVHFSWQRIAETEGNYLSQTRLIKVRKVPT